MVTVSTGFPLAAPVRFYAASSSPRQQPENLFPSPPPPLPARFSFVFLIWGFRVGGGLLKLSTRVVKKPSPDFGAVMRSSIQGSILSCSGLARWEEVGLACLGWTLARYVSLDRDPLDF